MLQRLSHHIAASYERAADCTQRAEQTSDLASKKDLLELARTWTHLAHSYEFVESLERFLLNALNARKYTNQEPPHDPTCPDQSRKS